VKLRACATTVNAARSSGLARLIVQSCSRILSIYPT
jgi:hypothetical protein